MKHRTEKRSNVELVKLGVLNKTNTNIVLSPLVRHRTQKKTHNREEEKHLLCLIHLKYKIRLKAKTFTAPF
jgi:hypothetical protein